MADVKIGTLFFTEDYDFIFQDISVSPPKTSKKILAIPGTSATIDLTESVSGDVEYEPRVLTISGQAVDGVKRWAYNYSRFMNDVHGRLLQIVATNDPGFYWLGRVEVNQFNVKPTGADVEVSATVDPYKYEITSSLEPWLWDNFSFLDGIIREYSDLVVPGTLVLPGRRKRICPKFICSEAMSVTYLTVAYALATGENIIPEIYLGAGDHTLTFTGTGTVSVDYRGASL